MKDLVSICVPTYNGADYIEESIESILDQTHQNLDIVFIDDQSKDNTISIIKSYMEKDQRIRLIQNSKNLGLVGNWNNCLKEAKGKWIKFHFQDDLMLPTTVEKMLSMLIREKVDLVLTDREYLFGKGMNEDYFDNLVRLSNYFKEDSIISPDESGHLFEELSIEHNYLGEPIIGMFNTKIINSLGHFDEELHQIVDFEFWLRIMSNVNTGFIPEKLHLFRVHAKSQGAKNMSQTGVLVSDLDKINLAYKIATHNQYATLRHSIGDEKINEMLAPTIKDQLLANGLLALNKRIKSEVFNHFKPTLKTKYRALKRDYKNYKRGIKS